MRTHHIIAALLTGTSLGIVPAAAQETQPAQTAQIQPTEILVTARRRTERIQDVPVAVTAVSGDQLARKGVIDVMDLRRAAPALNVSESPGSGRNMLGFILMEVRNVLRDAEDETSPAVEKYVARLKRI